MLMSTILKVDVIDVAMTSTTVLTTELRDFLYNQCTDNTYCYWFFIYPMDQIRVCKISFVSIGESHGSLCLVCKKRRLISADSGNIWCDIRTECEFYTKLQSIIVRSELCSSFILSTVSCKHMSHIMRKPALALCEQQRCRSACSSVQSDQHLCCSLLR